MELDCNNSHLTHVHADFKHEICLAVFDCVRAKFVPFLSESLRAGLVAVHLRTRSNTIRLRLHGHGSPSDGQGVLDAGFKATERPPPGPGARDDCAYRSPAMRTAVLAPAAAWSCVICQRTCCDGDGYDTDMGTCFVCTVD